MSVPVHCDFSFSEIDVRVVDGAVRGGGWGLGERLLSVHTVYAQIGEGDSNWQVGGRTLDARASGPGPRTKQDVFK